MTAHRRIISMLVAAVACLAASPATFASPLLSGYGGPGEGSQSILGSTLLNGPGGGGGGSANGPANNSSGSFRYGEPSHATGGSGTTGSGTRGSRTGGPTGTLGAGSKRRGATSGAGRTSNVESSAGVTYPYGSSSGVRRVSPAVEAAEVAAAGSQTLGLSPDDFLYVLFVLALLVATGVFTGRLARGHRAPPAAQGTAPRTRVVK